MMRIYFYHRLFVLNILLFGPTNVPLCHSWTCRAITILWYPEFGSHLELQLHIPVPQYQVPEMALLSLLCDLTTLLVLHFHNDGEVGSDLAYNRRTATCFSCCYCHLLFNNRIPLSLASLLPSTLLSPALSQEPGLHTERKRKQAM